MSEENEKVAGGTTFQENNKADGSDAFVSNHSTKPSAIQALLNQASERILNDPVGFCRKNGGQR